MKIAFLSMEDMSGFVSDDEIAIHELERRGHRVVTRPWRTSTFDDVDVAIVRTTWDYFRFPAEFLTTLRALDKVTRLLNPLALIEWNLDKHYLVELQSRGVAIVPTLFDGDIAGGFAQFGDEIVVKPFVSAGAEQTYILKAGGEVIRPVGDFMVQPFLPTIRCEGEYSLFYFAGAYSHAVQKVPKAGDFRVQEEHGGVIRSITPSAEMLARANRAMTAAQGALYARVDLVPFGGDFVLMELELIEPALYFQYGSNAAANFADAIERIL